MTDLIKTVYRELRDIVSRVSAYNLTGRWVDVHFKTPPLDGARGIAFQGDNGRGVVYVDPSLSDDQMLKTILHEFSHVKLDYQKMMHVKNKKSLSGRYMSEVKLLPKARENKAADLAEAWFSIANDLKPNGDFLTRLSALNSFMNKGNK